MLYLDTALIVKLYADETGSETVRSLVTESVAPVASSVLARPEAAAALHRKLREGAINSRELGLLLDQFQDDQSAGCYSWIPLSANVLARVDEVMRHLPPTITLFAGDAIHLAAAAEAGFRLVHSNDPRFLDAAPQFGLRGANPIA